MKGGDDDGSGYIGINVGYGMSFPTMDNRRAEMIIVSE
jgi:hypothetical protein